MHFTTDQIVDILKLTAAMRTDPTIYNKEEYVSTEFRERVDILFSAATVASQKIMEAMDINKIDQHMDNQSDKLGQLKILLESIDETLGQIKEKKE